MCVVPHALCVEYPVFNILPRDSLFLLTEAHGLNVMLITPTASAAAKYCRAVGGIH